MEYLKFNNFICFFFNLKSGQYLLDFKKIIQKQESFFDIFKQNLTLAINIWLEWNYSF